MNEGDSGEDDDSTTMSGTLMIRTAKAIAKHKSQGKEKPLRPRLMRNRGGRGFVIA